MATIQPIAPHEVVEKKLNQIPDVVIESFNELIAKNFNGRDATITQDEVIERILSKNSKFDRRSIYDNHWLDVEDIYRSIGWNVQYDKPGYNETYRAFFIFKKK